jgi:hypothetical protein
MLEAVERYRLQPPAGRTPEQLGVFLKALTGIRDRLSLAICADAATFAATEEFTEEFAALTPGQWLQHNCHLASGEAWKAVTVGQQMASLPGSVAALTERRIGFEHLALIASTANLVSLSNTASAFQEGPLLKQAARHSVARFRVDCAHARHAADAAAVLLEYHDAVEARRLELIVHGDGSVALDGLLPPEQGAKLRLVLAPLIGRISPDDIRTVKQRRHDALMEVIDQVLRTGFTARPGIGPVPQLHVTASLETLLGQAGASAGELDLSIPLPAATVQRLACEGSVSRVLLDAESLAFDVGRARRMPATATRVAIANRDRGCVWPGCNRPASMTKPHHLEHWGKGGDNHGSLCDHHHFLVHEGGYGIFPLEGEWVVIPPDPGWRPPIRAPG